jgi:hypothetical protein
MDLYIKLLRFFEHCIHEHAAIFTHFDNTFSESEKRLLRNILVKCYDEQNPSTNSIFPEERIHKIVIHNPKLETYPYKSLKYYFEAIIYLYKGESIDEYLKNTLFCGIFKHL